VNKIGVGKYHQQIVLDVLAYGDHFGDALGILEDVESGR
jgi:hypothetical protein